MYTCDICQREFSTKRSLASHRNHHNEDYHKKSSSAVKFLQSEKAEESRKKVTETKKYENWKAKNSSGCITCGKELVYPQEKTCSETCQKTYRSNANKKPHSEETKQKIRDRVNQIIQEEIDSGKRTIKTCACKICGTTIPNTTWKKRTVCDDEVCIEEARKQVGKKISDSIKKAFSEGRHLGNQYRNRKNPSYLEQSFITYIEQNYPSVKYEFNYTVRITDENGKYVKNFYIDFYFPLQHIGIELDGKQHMQTVKTDAVRDNTILESHGIPIHRISYREYFNHSKKEWIDSVLNTESNLQQTIGC